MKTVQKRWWSVGTSGSRIQQCSALNTIHVNCNHRIHHSFSLYARCGHQLVSRYRFVADRCMMSSATDLAARSAFALSNAVSTSCTIETQLFQTQFLPGVSNCHKLVTIYSSVVSCVTVNKSSLFWRCFVYMKRFFAIAEFSTLLPCNIRAAHNGVDFLPTFQKLLSTVGSPSPASLFLLSS